MADLRAVLSAEPASEVRFSTGLCVEKVPHGLQYAEPWNSLEGGYRLSLVRLILVGKPIATREVELVLRTTITAVGQLPGRQRGRSTKE